MVIELCLFLIFIYKPQYLKFLEFRWITKVGQSSYFLYLIHEHIGVLTIALLGTAIFPGSLAVPVLLILVLIAVSILFTKYVDNPLAGWLKKKLLDN
jgi:peptidoglycan/LPS O-acetylase OafA/YrhL